MEHTRERETPLDEVAEGVYLGELARGDRASVMYWRIEPGASLPVHEHDNEQIGYVLRGQLTALAGGEEVHLEAGDCYRFRSRERHGAENRSAEPTIGLGYLSPPRDRPDWGDRD